MKHLATICFLLMFFLATVADGKPAIYLRASQSKKTQNKKNEYGDIDKIQKQGVDIILRNMGDEEEVTVQWLFIAKNNQDKKLWTYSYDGETCKLKKGESKSISASSDKLVAKSYDIYFGVDSKPYGYVVVVFKGEDIIKCVASSHTLQKKCSDWAGFEEMLNSAPSEE